MIEMQMMISIAVCVHMRAKKEKRYNIEKIKDNKQFNSISKSKDFDGSTGSDMK